MTLGVYVLMEDGGVAILNITIKFAFGNNYNPTII